MKQRTRSGLIAGGVAAIVSGAPSTIHALIAGRSPLEATVAAGSLLAPGASDKVRVLAAVPVHLALSLGWGVVLAHGLPARRRAAWGAVAGLGIAVLDLGLVGRRLPAIRALPLAPQVADHVAFGAAVGAVLDRVEAEVTRPSPAG